MIQESNSPPSFKQRQSFPVERSLYLRSFETLPHPSYRESQRNPFFESPRYNSFSQSRCRYPVESWGIILYSLATLPNGETKPVFLIYQRRDSFEYVEVMRGVWSSESKLPILFSLMTCEEKERIKNYSFDELWKDLWIDQGGKTLDGYEKAKKKWEIIKPCMEKYLLTPSLGCATPPWGFPKGKKSNSREDGVTCALREFGEETRMDTSSITIRKDIDPLVEIYRGSNGKVYKTYYYLAQCPQVMTVDKMDTPNGIRKQAISEEASEVMWGVYEEIRTKLDHRKQRLIKKILWLLKIN